MMAETDCGWRVTSVVPPVRNPDGEGAVALELVSE